MGSPTFIQDNQLALSTLFLFIVLVFIPLIFLHFMNAHMSKIHKEVNKLRQEIVKISLKKADCLKKTDKEKKETNKS